MDEKDKTIQKLTRENLTMLLELHAIKECVTCIHHDEMKDHCDLYQFGYCCRDYPYEWRGVDAAEKWHEHQEQLKMLEQLL